MIRQVKKRVFTTFRKKQEAKSKKAKAVHEVALAMMKSHGIPSVDLNTELIKRLKVGVVGHLATFWKKTDYSAKKGFSFGYDFTVDSIKRIRREWEERDKELELKVKDGYYSIRVSHLKTAKIKKLDDNKYEVVYADNSAQVTTITLK